jgi:hypothetical protein
MCSEQITKHISPTQHWAYIINKLKYSLFRAVTMLFSIFP